ncbi:MAG: hypothetical protein JST81_15150 [Bacteroidetes bacterium]|nr:hypothetical protein [Bacteroidota bacterium]
MTRQQHIDFLERDIKNAIETGLKMTVSFIAKNCCAACDKIDGKEISMEKLLDTRPLPYKECIRQGECACCYAFNPVRDANGRLIEHKYK